MSSSTQPLVDVYLAPPLWQHLDFKGKVVVVIDQLRATSTIVAAIEYGATGILPVRSEDAAFAKRDELGDKAILIGEMNQQLIPGFDLNNSPRAVKDRVLNKIAVMKSTNGTKALIAAEKAELLVAQSSLNSKAVSEFLAGVDRDIAVLLSGMQGRYSLEDAVGAGFLIDHLGSNGEWTFGDGAITCQVLAKHFENDLEQLLRMSEHGQETLRIGSEEDLKVCADIDTIQSVPVLVDGMLVKAKQNAVEMLTARAD